MTQRSPQAPDVLDSLDWLVGQAKRASVGLAWANNIEGST